MTGRMKLLELSSANKLDAVQTVARYFIDYGLRIVDMDLARPWGFYFYFDPAQTEDFINIFYSGVELSGIDSSLPLQPKVLVFEPGKMNSWQYHHRRAEIWRCITATIQAVSSQSDEQPAPTTLNFGDVINFTEGMRHRGGAPAGQWSAVAEIWQHTDPAHPSNEEDIVRLADDFGRSS